MNAELLLAHFNRITAAPGAIARLRLFVLDLAVRGKLVEQHPDDEPATKLMNRIAKQRAQKAGTGTAGARAIVFNASDPAPFSVPASWVWVRLGDICSKTGSGSTPRGGRSVYQNSGVPFLRSQNVHNDGLRLDDVAYISDETHERMSGTAVEPNDLLLNITGGSIGRCCFVLEGFDKANISQHVAIIRTAADGVQGYLHQLVLSPYFQSFVIGEQTGAGRLGLPKNKMDRIPVALPPLPEQQRIVEKVDELMALCDGLEAKQREQETRRDQLTASTHHHLNNGADAKSLRGHAQFFIGHLPRLAASPNQIKQLRQTILDLATKSQLDTWSGEDEPMKMTLERRIKLPSGFQRRRKILKESSVSAPKDLFPSIPSSWQYKDVQSLYDLNVVIDYADGNHGSLYPRSSEFGDSGVRFISAKDIAGGRVVWNTCALLNEQRAKQLTKGWAQGGDVLLTHNATVGRVARVEMDAGKFLLGTSVTFYRLNQSVLDPGYFFYFLQSSIWQGQLEAIMQQTTRNQVSIQKQANFLVAVPPVAEQHRIVAKVDGLMALCDQLEASLTKVQTEAGRLLESVLYNALNESAAS